MILDERGRSSFPELQADLDRHGSERAVLYAFDLLFLDGEVLWTKPLEERRLALGRVVPPRSAILMSEEYVGDGAACSASPASRILRASSPSASTSPTGAGAPATGSRPNA